MGLTEWVMIAAGSVAGIYLEYQLIAAAVKRGTLEAHASRDSGMPCPRDIGRDLAIKVVGTILALAGIVAAAAALEVAGMAKWAANMYRQLFP